MIQLSTMVLQNLCVGRSFRLTRVEGTAGGIPPRPRGMLPHWHDLVWTACVIHDAASWRLLTRVHVKRPPRRNGDTKTRLSRGRYEV